MNRAILTSSAMLLALILAKASAQETYPFDGNAWRIEGDAEVEPLAAGGAALRIGNGVAFLDDAAFRDGTVEFDIHVTGDRAFVYLMFRGQNNEEYEDFYLRPHKSGLPDAAQYAPVFQRRSAWQLYYGERGTAATKIPANVWTRVRLKAIGSSATMWVGNDDEPAMTIENLGRDPAPGWLAVRGFLPQNSTAAYAAKFRGFRVTRANSNPEDAVADTAVPAGQLMAWRVSPAFDAPVGPLLEIPDDIARAEWSVPPVQENGVFEFLRSRRIPDGSRHWAVAAETTLRADEPTRCALHLGYSDELTLSLNGSPLVYQDSSYRFGGERQDGVMHQNQLHVFLHLTRGENRLGAVVADRFGGWGLSARLSGCEGVSEL